MRSTTRCGRHEKQPKLLIWKLKRFLKTTNLIRQRFFDDILYFLPFSSLAFQELASRFRLFLVTVSSKYKPASRKSSVYTVLNWLSGPKYESRHRGIERIDRLFCLNKNKYVYQNGFKLSNIQGLCMGNFVIWKSTNCWGVYLQVIVFKILKN